MTNIDDVLSEIGKSMDSILNADTNGFLFRTVQPWPGDIFDLHYENGNVERFSYVSDSHIIPLHRIDNGVFVGYSGYGETSVDTVTWDDVVYAADNSNDENVYLKTVFSMSQTNVTAVEVIDMLNEWAVGNSNNQESIMLYNIVEKIRGM